MHTLILTCLTLTLLQFAIQHMICKVSAEKVKKGITNKMVSPRSYESSNRYFKFKHDNQEFEFECSTILHFKAIPKPPSTQKSFQDIENEEETDLVFQTQAKMMTKLIYTITVEDKLTDASKTKLTRFRNNCQIVVVMILNSRSESALMTNENKNEDSNTSLFKILKRRLSPITSFSQDFFILKLITDISLNSSNKKHLKQIQSETNVNENQYENQEEQLILFSRKLRNFQILLLEAEKKIQGVNPAAIKISNQYENEATYEFYQTLTTFSNTPASAESPLKIQLSGRNLKLAGITVAPLLLLDGTKGEVQNKNQDNMSNVKGGTFHLFFQTASKFYNFTYSINTDLFKKAGPGRMSMSKVMNGSNSKPVPVWTGVIGSIVRDECDLTFMGHQVSRYAFMHFSTPLFYDESIFIIAQPNIFINWQAALIGPLTPTVWTFLLVSILLISSTFYVLIRYRGSFQMKGSESNLDYNERQSYSRSRSRSRSQSHSQYHSESKGHKDAVYLSWAIPIAVFFEQDVKFPKTIQSLVAVWMFCMIVITTGYKDKLFAFLTLPEMEPIPRNLHELAIADGKKPYKIVLDGLLISYRLNNSRSSAILKLARRFQVKRDTTQCVMEAAFGSSEGSSRKKPMVCLGYKPMLMVAIASNLTLNYDFKPTAQSQNILAHVHVSVAMGKNSWLIPDWERIVGWYRDAGMYEQSKEVVLTGFKRRGRAWLRANREGHAFKRLSAMLAKWGQNVAPLKVQHFYGLGAVYLGASFMAVVAFLVEIRSLFRISSIPFILKQAQKFRLRSISARTTGAARKCDTSFDIRFYGGGHRLALDVL